LEIRCGKTIVKNTTRYILVKSLNPCNKRLPKPNASKELNKKFKFSESKAISKSRADRIASWFFV